MIRRSLFAVAAVAAFSVVQAAEAGVVYSFQGLTFNNAANTAIGEAQLSLEVSQVGADKVEFKFSNTGPAAAVITQAYWEDGAGVLASIDSIANGAGVDFKTGAAPGHLPGSNPHINDFKVSAKNPAPTNGVNPGEFVKVVFNLVNTKSFNDVLAGINLDLLKIGVHVQSYRNGGSESFVVGGNVVPTPAAAGMGFALMGLGLLRRNRAA